MSEFSVKIAESYSNAKSLEEYAKKLRSKASEIERIKVKISLGSSSANVKKALADCIAETSMNEKDLKLLSSQLKVIIDEYKKAERNLNQQEGSKTDLDKSDDGSEGITTKEENKDLLNEQELELIKEILFFVLGFVPGINCVVDAISLYENWQKAWKDGDLSWDEGLVLAFDIIALIGDVIQVGQIVKSLVKGSKKLKLANTAAKKVTEATAKRNIVKETTEHIVEGFKDNLKNIDSAIQAEMLEEKVFDS